MQEIQTEIDTLLDNAITSIKEVINSDKLTPHSKIVAIHYLTDRELEYQECVIMGAMKPIAVSWQGLESQEA